MVILDIKKCTECENDRFFCQKLWGNARGEIFVVYCGDCGKFDTLKMDGGESLSQLQEAVETTWNNLNS